MTNVKSGQDEGDKGWTKDEEGESSGPGQCSAAEIKIKLD